MSLSESSKTAEEVNVVDGYLIWITYVGTRTTTGAGLGRDRLRSKYGNWWRLPSPATATRREPGKERRGLFTAAVHHPVARGSPFDIQRCKGL